MSSQVSSWTLMGDFVVQECCVHGTDLESHGPTSILCDDPLPLLTSGQLPSTPCHGKGRQCVCRWSQSHNKQTGCHDAISLQPPHSPHHSANTCRQHCYIINFGNNTVLHGFSGVSILFCELVFFHK